VWVLHQSAWASLRTRPLSAEFFAEVGVPVASRTTPPPKLDPPAQAEFRAKAEALAPKYRTELLRHA
jgi:hypothetical protein